MDRILLPGFFSRLDAILSAVSRRHHPRNRAVGSHRVTTELDRTWAEIQLLSLLRPWIYLNASWYDHAALEFPGRFSAMIESHARIGCDWHRLHFIDLILFSWFEYDSRELRRRSCIEKLKWKPEGGGGGEEGREAHRDVDLPSVCLIYYDLTESIAVRSTPIAFWLDNESRSGGGRGRGREGLREEGLICIRVHDVSNEASVRKSRHLIGGKRAGDVITSAPSRDCRSFANGIRRAQFESGIISNHVQVPPNFHI